MASSQLLQTVSPYFKKYNNEKTTIYCITVSYVEQL